MKPIIVIGAGMAGYTLAREFRKLDKNRPLLIFTADDGGFYSKPMLSNAFAQGKQAEQLVSQSAAQMAAQLSATIITGTRVGHIDVGGKKVEAGAGIFEYEQMVIAVGAQPVRLPLGGDAASEVMAVNHLADYAQFRRNLAQAGAPARVTIVGAGLIGCEFADDLAAGGHRVTLVDPNPRPLAALAAPALSDGLRAALIARGVDFRLGTTALRVERMAGGLQVGLANGDSIETDFVLSAVGLRPDLRLAQDAGLQTGRGILVNEHGRTSAPDVYALGDCAEYSIAGKSSVLPYIAPIMAAARAIARTLHGEPSTIDLKPAPVIVKTPCYPLALIAPPAGSAGAWRDTEDGVRTICRFYDADGVMAGFGVAPQEAALRQGLLAELGSKALDAV
jgi:rubredoxin-NAD+ reductase